MRTVRENNNGSWDVWIGDKVERTFSTEAEALSYAAYRNTLVIADNHSRRLDNLTRAFKNLSDFVRQMSADQKAYSHELEERLVGVEEALKFLEVEPEPEAPAL